MKYRNIIIFLSFIVFALQFLGFPQSWDNAFYAFCGILIAVFSYLSGREKKQAPVAESPSEQSTIVNVSA